MENEKTTNNKNEYKITLKKPADFNDIGSFTSLTNKEIGNLINSVMKSVFTDFYGCVITYMPNAYTQTLDLQVMFYFEIYAKEYYTDEKTTAFKPIMAEERSNKFDLNLFKRVFSNGVSDIERFISITDEGKSALIDLFNIDNIKPENLSNFWEIKEADNGLKVCMSGISLIKLIELIFGDYDQEKKTKIVYTINPSYPSTQQMGPTIFNIRIDKYNTSVVNDRAETLGLMPRSSIFRA